MGVANPQKVERLEARITARQKALLQHAAALEGTSLTEFVVRSAQRAAEQTVKAHTALHLTARESEAFVQAFLNPPEPSATLRGAAERYRQLVATT
jgi:uncharacterized protein (DUF1778 family)